MTVTPADLVGVRESARAYIAAGARHVILNLRAPYPEGICHRLVGEVVEPLRQAHAAG